MVPIRNLVNYIVVMIMQNDKTMMMNKKKEITIRLESLEKRVQLRDGTSS